MKHLRCLLAIMLVVTAALGLAAENSAPDGSWTKLDADQLASRAKTASRTWVNPDVYSAYTVNLPVVEGQAQAAPSEAGRIARTSGATITVPRPDGKFETFRILDVSTMEPELAAEFPTIRTFSGVGVEDPSANIRGDVGPQGFRASVRSGSDSYYVDPLYIGETDLHISYFLKDAGADSNLSCHVQGTSGNLPQSHPYSRKVRGAFGTDFRTVRLAIATTGEYAATVDGTVAGTQAAIVSVVNRVNQVYEAEVGVRLILVANNTDLIYIDPLTDPYDDDVITALVGQNNENAANVLGLSNYDVSQVLNSTGSGLASFTSVCDDTKKGRGTSSIRGGSPLDNQSVYHLAHELGHQFGADHSWNGVDGNCNPDNYAANAAFEPGSGSTIMAYPGTCSSDNLRIGKEAYFHRYNLDQMQTFIDSSLSCATLDPSGNNPPLANAGADIVVPINTPFKLNASGSDVDSDVLFYCWEQFDLATAQRAFFAPDDGTGPIFRSQFPTANTARYFPNNVGNPVNGEAVMFSVPERDRNFQVTVRDFRGGTNNDSMVVHTIAAPAAAFRVTTGNTPGEHWTGATKVITWDVAGTDTLPFNIFSVHIMMSIDGGATFPYMLKSNTPNDGTEVVNLPNVNSSQVRIRVEPTGSGVFDVSDSNVVIGGNLEVNPAVLDFGIVCPGVTQDKTFRVYNTGSGDLTIHTITKSGSDAFTLVPTDANPQPSLPLVLAPGDSVDFTVHLDSTATPVGPISTQFTVNSSDLTGSSKFVTAAATIGEPNITVAPVPLAFGTVCPENLQSNEKTVSVCNSGMCPLNITDIAMSNTEFTVVGLPALPITVQPGSCLEFDVRFTPSSVGPKSATLSVTSNDPDTPVSEVAVTGETLASTLSTTEKIGFQPAVVTTIGHCPADEPLVVAGTGLCNVKVTTVTITGTNAGSFSLIGLPTSANPLVLAPGEQLGGGSLKVRFLPDAVITERFHRAEANVTYITDPFTNEETTVIIPLAGEAAQTGFRLLVRAGGVPVEKVDKITATVKGSKASGKQNKTNLQVANANLRTVTAPDPFASDLSFQFHAEFGGLTNSIQLPTGDVQLKVQIKIGKKKKTKTVGFQNLSTCSFNKDVVIDF